MSNPTVRYVRRAIEEARNKGGMIAGMPKVTMFASDAEMLCIIADQVERLQDRVAEKCDAPVGWIAPDKYKAACESKMEFFNTIKELREKNEKLKARVAELQQAAHMKQNLAIEWKVAKDKAEARVAELLVQAPGAAVVLATAILDGIAKELSKGSGLGKKMARIRVAVRASELRFLTENADRVLRNDSENSVSDT